MPASTARSQTNGFARPDASSETNLEGVRILVVDDRSDERDLLKMILVREGSEVKTAASAAEALTTIKTWRPDILISDIAMPTEDGYSLVKKIRALDDRVIAAVPAIALTAHARVEDRQQALDAGFDYHVGKPFDRAKLIDAVGAAADLTAGARLRRPKSPAQGTRT